MLQLQRSDKGFLLSILLTAVALYAHANTDSLKLLLREQHPDTVRIGIYLGLFNNYVVSDTAEASYYLSKAIKLSDSIQNNHWQCRAKLATCKFLRSKGQMNRARQVLADISSGCLHSGVRSIDSWYYSESGIVKFIEGDYNGALGDFIQSMTIDESLGNTENLAKTYNNVANVYWEIEKLDDALGYYHKSLKIYEDAGNEKESSDVLGNIGLIYRAKGEYDKALEYYFKSLSLDRKYKNRLSEAINLQNIGALYQMTGNHPLALKYLIDSRNISEEINDPIGTLYASHGIANVYSALGRDEESISLLREALDLAGKLKMKEEMKNIFKDLADLFERKGQLAKALEYRKRFEVLKDSLAGENYAKAIKEMEIRYETEKKDNQIALLAKEKELQTKETERQSTLKKAFIAGFVFVVVLAALLVYAIRQRLLLVTKDNEIKEASLRQQLTELEIKALRAQINPHFLFNCLTSINRMIVKGENEEASAYLKKFSKLVRLIVENSQSSRVSLENELALIESYIQLEGLRFKGKISYDICVDKSIEMDNTFLPPMILQPFVENAIWHGLMHRQADDQGQIRILVSEDNDVLRCTIEDNGIGRKESEKYKEKENGKSKSLGIAMTVERLKLLTRDQIKDLVKIVDLNDISSEASGTRVEINIPLS